MGGWPVELWPLEELEHFSALSALTQSSPVFSVDLIALVTPPWLPSGNLIPLLLCLLVR